MGVARLKDDVAAGEADSGQYPPGGRVCHENCQASAFSDARGTGVPYGEFER
jgi:hypothetical protein